MSIQCKETRWGTMYYEGKDEFVGRSLHNYGEYNPDETETIISLAKGLCLDIGANFGVMTKALEDNGFECIAFEPQPYVFNILKKNVTTCYNCGLGDVEGTFKMPRIFEGDKANYGGVGILKSKVILSPTIDIQVRTLDSFNFQNVGFIKIDVEGFEERVLKGAVDTINRCKPTMYIEDDRVECRSSLRAFIKSLGYSYKEHQPLLYRENNFYNLKRNIWNRDYASHNLICEPI